MDLHTSIQLIKYYFDRVVDDVEAAGSLLATLASASTTSCRIDHMGLRRGYSGLFGSGRGLGRQMAMITGFRTVSYGLMCIGCKFGEGSCL